MGESQRGGKGTWRELVLWDNGEIDLRASRAALPASDQDAARLMARVLYPDLLHFVPGTKGGWWYIWEGRYHRRDESLEIGRLISLLADMMATALEHCRQRLAIETAAKMSGKTQAEIDKAVDKAWKETWGPVAAMAGRLRGSAGSGAMAKKLAEECGTTQETMDDHHRYLLNVANGILDLRTGKLWDHHPQALMTYILEARWDPAAECELFKSMLWRCCGWNEDAYWAMADALGYSIGGHNELHKIFFFSGAEGNGKSKILTIVSTVLGQLAHQGDVALISRGKGDRNAREEFSIRNMRLVAISETHARINIDEAQLKKLTGQDSLAVNQHYAERKVETETTWVIIVATNEMPRALRVDGGMKRRIIVIPLGPPIPEGEMDLYIANRVLETEKDGVLALLVAGYQRAMAHHFAELPACVRAETDLWIADQDTIENWLADECELAPDGPVALNGQAGEYSEQPAVLWERYDKWCGPVPHHNRTEFFRFLEGRHGIYRTGDKRLFMGVRLCEPSWRRD